MSKSSFEVRLAEARKVSARSGILTVAGAVLVAGALAAIVWQYKQARQARDEATEAKERAEKAERSLSSLRDEYAELSNRLGGELTIASQNIKSLEGDLEALRRSGGSPADIQAALDKSKAASATVTRQSEAAKDALDDLRMQSQRIQQTRLPEQTTVRPEQTIPPGDRNKPILQLIVGDEQTKAKAIASRTKMGEQYHYVGVRIARRPPDVTEVRYYRNPEDAGEASRILQELKEKCGLRGTGRISFVLDPDQPPRFFQIALAKGALP